MSVKANQPTKLVANRALRAKLSEAYADQSAQQLREKLIIDFLPLVRHVVRKITSPISSNMDIEDLISAGTLGLVKAAHAFDPTREVEFKTYAYIRIRGAVIDEMRSRSFVPVNVHKQISLAQETFRKFSAQHGRPPSDEELASKLNWSIEQLHKSFEEARKQHFLSIHGLSEDQPALASLVPADSTPTPDAIAQRKEMARRLARAITELPKKDRMVVLLYYERDLTMKEIAQVLSITESRVSQIHASALFKLSMKLKEKYE